MTCTPEQAAGADLAIRKGMGTNIPDALVQEALPLASQLSYSKHTGTILDHMVTDAIDKDVHMPVSFLGNQLRKIGVLDSWITENLDPQDYLGRNFTQPLLDVLQQHHEMIAQDTKDHSVFDSQVLPTIEHLQSLVDSHFKNDLARKNYANQWLEFWGKGGSFYREPVKQGAISQGINNVVKNLISENPFIAVAHTFQIGPRAVAIYGPEATLKGINSWVQAVNQAKTIHLPELMAKGALHEPSPLFGKIPDITAAGDNIGRGLAYHIAEAAHPGRGMEGVHNVAYAWQPGREPMVLWNHADAMHMALQRYAISGAKMYGGWLRNLYDGVRTGNTELAVKGATAIASFSIMQSIFTGVKSAIPAPVYHLLPQDTRDQVDEINAQIPNVTGLFGRDMSEHYQPVGGLGFGIAANILNEDIKSAGGDIKKGVQAVDDGDIVKAAVELTKAGLIGGQALVPDGKLPLVIKKVFDVAGDVITGDKAPEEAPEAVLKKLNFPAKAG